MRTIQMYEGPFLSPLSSGAEHRELVTLTITGSTFISVSIRCWRSDAVRRETEEQYPQLWSQNPGQGERENVSLSTMGTG